MCFLRQTKPQWSPDFLNSQFFQPPDNSNQKVVSSLSRTRLFYPRFLERNSDFSNQYSSPLGFRKIGIPLYLIFFLFKYDTPYFSLQEINAGAYIHRCIQCSYIYISGCLEVVYFCYYMAFFLWRYNET